MDLPEKPKSEGEDGPRPNGREEAQDCEGVISKTKSSRTIDADISVLSSQRIALSHIPLILFFFPPPNREITTRKWAAPLRKWPMLPSKHPRTSIGMAWPSFWSPMRLARSSRPFAEPSRRLTQPSRLNLARSGRFQFLPLFSFVIFTVARSLPFCLVLLMWVDFVWLECFEIVLILIVLFRNFYSCV